MLRILWVASGWSRLADKFRSSTAFQGEYYRFQSGRLNQVGFDRALEIGLNERGLFLVPMILFRLFHKPLLIPWCEIQAVPVKRFWLAGCRLTFRSVPGTSFEAYGGTFDKMADYLKRNVGLQQNPPPPVISSLSAEARTTNTGLMASEQVKNRLLALRLIHLALVGGVIMFGGVVLALTHRKMAFSPEFQNPLSIAAGGVAAISILASSFMHRIFYRGLDSVPADAQAALQKYQTFCLVRSALMEGASFFSAVATLVTCNILPASLLALCTVTLIARYPSVPEFTELTKPYSRTRAMHDGRRQRPGQA